MVSKDVGGAGQELERRLKRHSKGPECLLTLWVLSKIGMDNCPKDKGESEM